MSAVPAATSPRSVCGSRKETKDHSCWILSTLLQVRDGVILLLFYHGCAQVLVGWFVLMESFTVLLNEQ